MYWFRGEISASDVTRQLYFTTMFMFHKFQTPSMTYSYSVDGSHVARGFWC